MAKKKEESKRPRQQRLPGTEDAAIEVLEEKALEYADVRDQRISLSGQEGELKQELLALMKANKREHYQRGNILIDIVHEEENVKVKIKSASAEDEPSHERPKKKNKATDFDPTVMQQAEKTLPN
jgi:hypothetical protein